MTTRQSQFIKINDQQELIKTLQEALSGLVKVHNKQLEVSHSKITNPDAYVYAMEQAEGALKKVKKYERDSKSTSS